MRICIPVLENKYLASEVCEHFGKAPEYLVLDAGERTVEAVINHVGRAHEGVPVDKMVEHGVEAVVCHGLGEGAQRRLKAAGIRILGTESGSVEEVLWAVEYGTLEDLKGEHLHKGQNKHDNRKSDRRDD